MSDILNLYKERGETPLERINRLCKEQPQYLDVPTSYLGRLDPMAEGVLLVATGDANQRREDYLALPKTYEVDILLGVSTDTYDVLGKITDIVTRLNHPRPHALEIAGYLETRLGKQVQKYPPYSSKTVNGKPLHEWSREGRLNEIVVPEHEIEVHDCLMMGMNSITQKELLDKVLGDIAIVRGDFRQEEIAACWEAQLRPLYDFTFDLFKVRLAVGSGTYMRVIAHELGDHFGIPSLAYRLVRTAVGEFGVEDAMR